MAWLPDQRLAGAVCGTFDTNLHWQADGLPMTLFFIQRSAVRGRLRSHSPSATTTCPRPSRFRRGGMPGASRARCTTADSRKQRIRRHLTLRIEPADRDNLPGGPAPCAPDAPGSMRENPGMSALLQDVGAVLVVTRMGNRNADFMEHRRPFEEASIHVLLRGGRVELQQEGARRIRHLTGMDVIHAVALTKAETVASRRSWW